MNSFIIELGHISLISALVLSFIQFSILFVKIENNFIFIPAIPKLVFLTTAFSFFVLLYSFIVSDFSVDLVTKFSHTSKPLIYKISGTWANHEGSLLLWILILVLFGSITSSLKLENKFHSILTSAQGLLNFLFLALCIFTSNPFTRSEIIPTNGSGLNPVLQDLLLAFHPPILYFGYVGLSVAFCFALAALINGEINKKWASAVRPWIIISWIALTIGISLGSYWAYYELGWGGWWFWDPVENAALMPWLIATALLHSIIVFETRNELKSWTLLLCILGFSFSLLGTFIVRSGIITSVHSFASDPKRGLVILFILLVSTLIPLGIFAFKSESFRTNAHINLLSKEMSLVINNFILVISSFIILIGTMYPLLLELINGSQITVGKPFFLISLSPFMMATLFFMGVGPLLYWKRNYLRKTLNMFLIPILFTLIILILFVLVLDFPIISILGFTLSAWLFLNILYLIIKDTNLLSIFKSDRKIKSLTAQQLAVCIAHIGVATFSIGAVTENYFNQEIVKQLKPGEKIMLGNEYLIFKDIKQSLGPNYISEIGELTFYNKDNVAKYTLYPEKRLFPIERQTTSEVAIYRRISGDVYAVIGDGDPENGYTFRIYVKPLVSLIWLGSIIMVLGGIFSLKIQLKKASFRRIKII